MSAYGVHGLGFLVWVAGTQLQADCWTLSVPAFGACQKRPQMQHCTCSWPFGDAVPAAHLTITHLAFALSLAPSPAIALLLTSATLLPCPLPPCPAACPYSHPTAQPSNPKPYPPPPQGCDQGHPYC
jgi:hypothetical protein